MVPCLGPSGLIWGILVDVDVERAVLNKIDKNAVNYLPTGSNTPRSMGSQIQVPPKSPKLNLFKAIGKGNVSVVKQHMDAGTILTNSLFPPAILGRVPLSYI